MVSTTCSSRQAAVADLALHQRLRDHADRPRRRRPARHRPPRPSGRRARRRRPAASRGAPIERPSCRALRMNAGVGAGARAAVDADDELGDVMRPPSAATAPRTRAPPQRAATATPRRCRCPWRAWTAACSSSRHAVDRGFDRRVEQLDDQHQPSPSRPAAPPRSSCGRPRRPPAAAPRPASTPGERRFRGARQPQAVRSNSRSARTMRS